MYTSLNIWENSQTNSQTNFYPDVPQKVQNGLYKSEVILSYRFENLAATLYIVIDGQ